MTRRMTIPLFRQEPGTGSDRNKVLAGTFDVSLNPVMRHVAIIPDKPVLESRESFPAIFTDHVLY